MLSRGFTAGIGLLLIIPLLQLVGLELATSNNQEFSRLIEQAFTGLGIPLTLPSILITYIILVSTVALLSYYETVISATIQQSYICQLRDRLFRSLLHTRWQYIIQHRMSDFTHSLSSQVQTIGHAASTMLGFASQIIITMVYVVLSLLLSWQMSLLALICALALFAALLPLNKRIYESGSTELISYRQIFQMLTEQLASLKMIKSYASEKHYADELHQVGQTLEHQHITFTRINSLSRLVYLVGAAITFSILFYVAFHHLEISLATLLLLLFIFSRLLPQVSGIHSSYQQLVHQMPAFDHVRQLFEECELEQEPLPGSKTKTPTMNKQLQLTDICYTYPGKDEAVFENLNITIKHNESIALTGPSGAGKSTLADLVAGLLIPDSGDIICDGQPLTDNNRIAWRDTIAYVTQEVFLFHDTVRNNLSWVKQEATEGELWHVLETAAAKEFIEKLPNGLDTIIGDRGIRLSGGERQRLAIARALLSNPQLLILDEATSALDHENEKKIQETLERLQGKLTVIVIAHRETTIQHIKSVVQLGSTV